MSTENSTLRYDFVEGFVNIDYLSKTEFKLAYGLIVSSIILLNGFVILIILACRSLRETSYNCVTMSLSFTDFIVGCSIRPMINMQESNDFLGCAVTFSFYIGAITASNFHLFLVSLIRTHAFFKDKTIIRKIKRKTTIIIVCLTWFLAVIVVVNENVNWLQLENNPMLTAGCNFASLYQDDYVSVTRFHSLVHLITGFCTVLCSCILAYKLYARGVTNILPIEALSFHVNANTAANCIKNSKENVLGETVVSAIAEEFTLSKGKELTISNSSKHTYSNLAFSSAANGFTTKAFVHSNNIVRENVESYENEERTAERKPNMSFDDTDIEDIESVISNTNISPDIHCSETDKEVVASPTKQTQDISGDVKAQDKVDDSCYEIKTIRLISNPLNKARTRNILAIRTIIIIVVLHVIFTGPFYLYLFINGFLVGDEPRSTDTEMILLATATINSIVNPVVYIVRISEFRQACRKMKQKLTTLVCKR